MRSFMTFFLFTIVGSFLHFGCGDDKDSDDDTGADADTDADTDTDTDSDTDDDTDTSTCTEATRRCHGDIIQFCHDDEWNDWKDCAKIGATCEVVNGEAACVGGDTDTETDTDSDTDTEPDCIFGMDHTCNDDPTLSILCGYCDEDGLCNCFDGFEINPDTGKCKKSD